MTIDVSAVPKNLIELTWPDVSGYLKEAVDFSHGRERLPNVYGQLVTGKAQLWIVIDMEPSEGSSVIIAAIVTSIQSYALKRVLRIEYCGGSRMDEWLDGVLATLESFAVRHDTSAIEFLGREAWKKLLSKRGWTAPLVFYEKTLSDVGAKEDAA